MNQELVPGNLHICRCGAHGAIVFGDKTEPVNTATVLQKIYKLMLSIEFDDILTMLSKAFRWIKESRSGAENTFFASRQITLTGAYEIVYEAGEGIESVLASLFGPDDYKVSFNSRGDTGEMRISIQYAFRALAVVTEEEEQRFNEKMDKLRSHILRRISGDVLLV